MIKTIQYRLYSNAYVHKLEGDVDDALKAGWECQGGVAIRFNPTNYDTLFFQAMSKVTETPELSPV